jgi:CheY-like chemotaxis protein
MLLTYTMAGARLSSSIVVMVIGGSEIGQYSPAHLLRQKNFCVLTTPTVQDSLDLLHRFTDRLIVVIDIEVSQIAAEEAYQMIQQCRPQTPVLLISSEAKPLREPIPGVHVLAKPFRPQQFYAALEECCLPGATFNADVL